MHLFAKNNSNIFRHLKNSTSCRDAFSESWFKILDSASSYHNLKIMKAVHITWEGPNSDNQLQHYTVSLSFWLSLYKLLVLFAFLSLLFSINIFDC